MGIGRQLLPRVGKAPSTDSAEASEARASGALLLLPRGARLAHKAGKQRGQLADRGAENGSPGYWAPGRRRRLGRRLRRLQPTQRNEDRPRKPRIRRRTVWCGLAQARSRPPGIAITFGQLGATRTLGPSS